MTSRKGNQPATKAGNGAVHKQPNVKKLPYASRYVAVDSHLAERKSSSDLVLDQIRIGRDRGGGVCVWRLGQ